MQETQTELQIAKIANWKITDTISFYLQPTASPNSLNNLTIWTQNNQNRHVLPANQAHGVIIRHSTATAETNTQTQIHSQSRTESKTENTPVHVFANSFKYVVIFLILSLLLYKLKSILKCS